jgi:U3 small nucleolar ribonucleoprotein protein LCP5
MTVMTVANDTLPALLNSLTESLTIAESALTSDAHDFLPPHDGISLLDVKNDLLLSYLQNLAFLILFKLRNGNDDAQESSGNMHGSVVEKLIELRIYLERGVRPIEQRLKYTIDQYLQAAENQSRTRSARTSTGHLRDADAPDESDSESDADSVAPPNQSHDDGASHAPRLTAIAFQKSNGKMSQSSVTNTSGVYKPPRITPTAMPSADPDARSSVPRNRRSALMNEYVSSELSSAPQAVPSIGSNRTITDGGRSGLSARERERQRERTEYEELNFTRLPGESKAEKRKRKARGEERRDMFGGEDWTGLGGLGDRIERSVAGGKGEGVLKRREKRRATEDAPRSDGLQIGDSFEKRRKVLAGRAERKGKKR